MSTARLAALLVGLILPVSGMAFSPALAGPAPADAPGGPVSLRVLPPISQPGARATSADKAKVVLITRVKPRRAAAVRLQVRTSSGWRTIKKARTDSKGTYVFRAALRRGKGAATYRVRSGGNASSPVSTTRWLTPSFSDSFGGRKLKKAWTHRGTSYNPAVRRCSRADKRATKVGGGVLRLSVMKDPKRKKKCVAASNGVFGKYVYRLNGHVGTQESYTFTYGVAAARVKFPRQSGQHGAFWLQVDSPDLRKVNAKRNGTEMDVVESYGADMGAAEKSLGLGTGVHRYVKRNGQFTTVSDGGYVKNAAQYLSGRNDSFWGRYHVFSVEWTPRYYIYRIDGKEYWRTHKGISGTPQFPILSNLSSDYELGRLKNGDKDLPQHMKVDWLRVWETGPGAKR
ncbi:glycoside hydrolase family 16 protein [Nocardioides daphniae]|uniref:GH16 domain-containing protein n=1 Tax=Nocardioides daphniae TaxID=402297 RepID=A0ABQ1QBB4_9ACTN|nr:glycoside hydrolase family 16 protein [Nocardioides daphniae]GGD20550.1 hypothetical protein GCM10007231_19620 [Nocardioides daphniae]